MNATKKVVWIGDPPTICQLCESKISYGEPFVDGLVWRGNGAFALMCLPCHRLQGYGLGVGKGQRYELRDGEYVKTGG